MNLEKFLNYLDLDVNLRTGGLSLVFSTLILITLIQGLVRWFVFGRKLPPGPVGLPVVGYLPFLGKEPYKTFWNMREKYGNIIGVHIGPIYTVVLNDYSSMKDLMCHPAALNRAPGIFSGIGADGILTANGEKWQEQRKYVMSTVRNLSFGTNRWEDLIMEEIDIFTGKLRELKGKPTDISRLLSCSVVSSILILLTGRRLTDVGQIELCVEFSNLAFAFSNPSSVTSSVPALRKLCETLKIAGFDRYSEVNRKFAKLMTEEINRLKTVPESMNERNFITWHLEFLSEISNAERKKDYFSETELRGHLTALFLGNSDTIFSFLVWLFRLMCRHKDVQDKVRKELSDVLGADGRCDGRDRTPYTSAVIMEAHRYGSIVRLSTTRIASEDIHVKGYIIPKGSELTANLWAIHHDPSYWEEPEVFRPERFLTADGTQLVKPSTNYVPFSIGRRNCLGESIAHSEVCLYFAETLRNFEISTPAGMKPEFELMSGLITHLVPQALCFRERHN